MPDALLKSRTSADLAAVLETARHHEMTPEDIEAQRRSWVIGKIMLDDADLKRDEAEALYDQATREGA